MPQLTDNIVHKEDYDKFKYEMMLSYISVSPSLESVGYGVRMMYHSFLTT